MSRSKAAVFLALDVDTKDEAFSLVEKWSPHILGFKVGPRLGFQFTQSEWRWLSKKGEVFIDYKFFDIPSTVASSVKVAFDSGASFCTVHALNGLECLKGLAKLEKELNQIRPFKVLCVTLLTSFDQEGNVLPLSRNMEPAKVVNTLSDVVFESGLSGLVCSPREVSKVKERYPKGTFVIPGIRFATDSKDDQKRVATPEAAWADGATHLVMGRSLIRAKDFENTVKNLEASWQTV
ncbi:MAG: orotidine-5'-phosphate decarboxylase [Bdellovibrionales bacterium]